MTKKRHTEVHMTTSILSLLLQLFPETAEKKYNKEMRQKEDKAMLGKAEGGKGRTKLCIENMREEVGFGISLLF